jgi:hypothetical protein
LELKNHVNRFMKQFYFLSGLPRSGSTVLAAILNQHPDMHTSSTSGLLDMMFGTFQAWKKSLSSQADASEQAGELEIKRILRNIAEAKYAHVDKPIILDKSRGWCDATTMQVAAEVFEVKPKIIATVRDVPDCAASFLRAAKPKDKEDFLQNHHFIQHLQDSYVWLNSGFQLDPECILFVEYENLLADPQTELDRIHDFLGLNEYSYNLGNIDGSALAEKDEEVWGVKGLHNISPVLEKQHNESAKDLLEHFYTRFVQPCFWREETEEPKKDKLDLMLEQGLLGNLDEAKKIGKELALAEPKNHRAAFNSGWYAIRDGHLLEGMKLIDRGRIEKVFGNYGFKPNTEKWNGETGATVLLNLEGGLGDQIHTVRFAKDIARFGNKVIVACSGPLAQIICQVEGVTAIVQHEAAFGVIHDFWVPSMSAVIPLQLQYPDVDGAAYIPKPDVEKGKKFRIGLRWQGNPEFEHEQHRQFDSKLLFDAVKGVDAEFISLQRDEGAEHKPKWVKEACLDSWLDTAAAIASCDLVITSCTSVAHLSGAMGVPTWVVIPILPYYLWAKPGNTTEWYDSVKLFRQTRYGYWTEPFNEIKHDLKEEIKNANSKNRLLGTSKRRESGSSMGLRPSFGT